MMKCRQLVMWPLCLAVVALSGCSGPQPNVRGRSIMVADDYAGYWQAAVLSDKRKRDDFFAFCKAPHGDRSKPVNRIYLSAGWHGFDQISVDDQKLRAFIREVHDAGMEIYNLQGYHRWATPSGQDAAVRIIDNVLAFNRDSDASGRFDGIVLDIEPYLLKTSNKDELDWKQDQAQAWRIYLEVLEQLAARVRQYNESQPRDIQLGECIPAWYPRDHGGGGANFRDVMDRVDFVWVMNYYDTPDKLDQMAKDEIAYAGRIGKPIVIGLNVIEQDSSLDVGGANTFWDDGQRALENVIRSFENKYRDAPQFNEVSIFTYAYYKNLKP